MRRWFRNVMCRGLVSSSHHQLNTTRNESKQAGLGELEYVSAVGGEGGIDSKNPDSGGCVDCRVT